MSIEDFAYNILIYGPIILTAIYTAEYISKKPEVKLTQKEVKDITDKLPLPWL